MRKSRIISVPGGGFGSETDLSDDPSCNEDVAPMGPGFKLFLVIASMFLSPILIPLAIVLVVAALILTAMVAPIILFLYILGKLN